MEHFFSVIKVFIEKHLIPTIASVVLTVVSILLFPALSLIQNKTGLAIFWLFIFCCWFLLIHFAIWIVRKIKARILLVREHEERKREEITNVNSFFDNLTLDDKELITSFVLKENLPLRAIRYEVYDGSILGSHRKMFNVTPSPKGLEDSSYWVSPSSMMQYSSDSSFETDGSHLYKLKEAEYDALRTIYLKQGKLGNF